MGFVVVATGTVVARIAVGAGEPAAAPAPAAKQEGAAAAAPQAAEPAPAPAGNGDANVTPVAARIASAHGLDLTQVSGSGPRGRVTKTDVLAAIEGDGKGEAPPAAAPRPAGTTPIRGPAACRELRRGKCGGRASPPGHGQGPPAPQGGPPRAAEAPQSGWPPGAAHPGGRKDAEKRADQHDPPHDHADIAADDEVVAAALEP